MHQKLDNSLKRIPQNLGFRIIGVFDADMKSRLDTKDFLHPHVFLPGDGAPEHLFMYIANNLHLPFSSNLPRDHQELRAILGEIEAFEHHNWLDGLCDRLQLDKSLVIYALLKTWHEVQDGKDGLGSFVNELESHITG